MKRLVKITALVIGAGGVLGLITVSLSPALRNIVLHDIRFLVKMRRDNARDMLPAPHHPQPLTWKNDRITAAWLGHATMLINFYGVWIITDPIFSDQAGPNLGPFAVGPKRHVAPALAIDELPNIDLILLSHAHFDHFDMRSLAALAKRNPQAAVITAANTADLLSGKKFARIDELPWERSVTLSFQNKPLTVSAIHVKHWGARWRRDRERGFNGYLLEYAGHRICFSGDTAYTPAFTKLSVSGGVDLMFVPIGAYDPWIANHCSPEEAVQMADQAGAQYVFPMHFATFKLSNESMAEPLKRFQRAIRPDRIAGKEIGDIFTWP
ncbi:MAG: MBL fold metallo-hydrolase [Verrucomicrobiales bacterium]|jgi:L-ascorbate metabolism protein UlaG (beta-lactamase superfamily)|nr:MBL fold metallo-hydrolase [Verrucomicrobiales bacterium]